MILTFVQIGMRLMEVDPGFVLELIPTSKLPSTDALALLKLSIITSILFCLQFVLELYRTQLPSLHLLPALALISNYRVPPKNALSECCWSHSALAQSQAASTEAACY